MNRSARRQFLVPLLLLALLAHPTERALARGGGDDGGGNDSGALKLRLDDAIGTPGGTVALVIRTYAPRPLRQGRITVKVRKPGVKLGLDANAVTTPARPLTLQRVVVFSVAGDAIARPQAANAPDGQSVGVQFTSLSATVNAADGPLAVLFLKLDRNVKPGQVFLLDIDPAATGLTDPGGAPVAVTPLEATLRVRAASAPYAIESEGDEVAPGATAELGIETFEPFGIRSGRLTLRFDPQAAGGPAVVRMDPRYGKATFRVDGSRPGILVVDFQSKNVSLNSVPGRIIAISLPTSAAAPLGWSTPLTVDPQGTWLVGKRANRRLPVTIENGDLSFR
jgi:hypothetical protein